MNERNNNISYQCSLLVSSCDAYEDLWDPFFNLLGIYWSDCPFKIYLITEEKECNRKGIETIKAGKGGNWSDRLNIALQYLNQEYVLLMLEDFFLQKKIDNVQIHKSFNLIRDNNLNMFRLINRSGPNGIIFKDKNYGHIEKNTPFRVSTQASFWRTQVLKDLIKKDESIWKFEILGSKRADLYDNFCSVVKPVFTYKHHVVERGEWFPWSAYKFKKMNIGVDLNKRNIMSCRRTLHWLLFKLLTPIYLKMPKIIRIMLSNIRKIFERKNQGGTFI